MISFLRELAQNRKLVKIFITDQDVYEGILTHVDAIGVVLDVDDFIVVLPLSSIYVIEVEKFSNENCPECQ